MGAITRSECNFNPENRKEFYRLMTSGGSGDFNKEVLYKNEFERKLNEKDQTLNNYRVKLLRDGFMTKEKYIGEKLVLTLKMVIVNEK